MKMYIARDGNGNLFMHRNRPCLLHFCEVWDSDDYFRLEQKDFPEVTFENSPQEVEIVIKSNMMKLYIARNEDGSLALFRKKKPKLFWDEKLGQYWVGSSLWLDSNDYPEVTFENSPMEVELVIKK